MFTSDLFVVVVEVGLASSNLLNFLSHFSLHFSWNFRSAVCFFTSFKSFSYLTWLHCRLFLSVLHEHFITTFSWQSFSDEHEPEWQTRLHWCPHDILEKKVFFSKFKFNLVLKFILYCFAAWNFTRFQPVLFILTRTIPFVTLNVNKIILTVTFHFC